jgi:hypothetical protein
MYMPDSIIEDGEDDGSNSGVSEVESSLESGSGARRQVVAVGVPIAMWVSRFTEFLQ